MKYRTLLAAAIGSATLVAVLSPTGALATTLPITDGGVLNIVEFGADVAAITANSVCFDGGACGAATQTQITVSNQGSADFRLGGACRTDSGPM